MRWLDPGILTRRLRVRYPTQNLLDGITNSKGIGAGYTALMQIEMVVKLVCMERLKTQKYTLVK